MKVEIVSVQKKQQKPTTKPKQTATKYCVQTTFKCPQEANQDTYFKIIRSVKINPCQEAEKTCLE